MPKNSANKSPKPTIFNFAKSNAIQITPPKSSKIPFGFTKLAEPEGFSNGFIWSFEIKIYL